MAVLARVVVLVPLLLSIGVMVLSALALFAGHKEGFMEDYAIARLNVSRIGYDLFNGGDDEEANADNENEDDDDSSIWDDVKDTWDDTKETVVNEFNDLVGDVAGEAAEALGISEWYSLHVMDACEGNYRPNSTADNASLNITNCSDSKAGFRLNLTEMIDKELSAGPIELNLADFGWDERIQDKIDILNDALLGLFILYCLGMGFSGIAILGCIAAFILAESKIIVLVNFFVSSLAVLSLLVASILVTVAVTRGVDEINDVAEEIGVNVEMGTKFLIITWVAAGVMIAPVIFWAVRFCVMRKHTKRVRPSKEAY